MHYCIGICSVGIIVCICQFKLICRKYIFAEALLSERRKPYGNITYRKNCRQLFICLYSGRLRFALYTVHKGIPNNKNVLSTELYCFAYAFGISAAKYVFDNTVCKPAAIFSYNIKFMQCGGCGIQHNTGA